MTGTISPRGMRRTPPTGMGFIRSGGWTTGRGIPENTTTARFSMKNETPMALMSAEMRGAFRRGR